MEVLIKEAGGDPAMAEGLLKRYADAARQAFQALSTINSPTMTSLPMSMAENPLRAQAALSAQRSNLKSGTLELLLRMIAGTSIQPNRGDSSTMIRNVIAAGARDAAQRVEEAASALEQRRQIAEARFFALKTVDILTELAPKSGQDPSRTSALFTRYLEAAGLVLGAVSRRFQDYQNPAYTRLITVFKNPAHELIAELNRRSDLRPVLQGLDPALLESIVRRISSNDLANGSPDDMSPQAAGRLAVLAESTAGRSARMLALGPQLVDLSVADNWRSRLAGVRKFIDVAQRLPLPEEITYLTRLAQNQKFDFQEVVTAYTGQIARFTQEDPRATVQPYTVFLGSLVRVSLFLVEDGALFVRTPDGNVYRFSPRANARITIGRGREDSVQVNLPAVPQTEVVIRFNNERWEIPNQTPVPYTVSRPIPRISLPGFFTAKFAVPRSPSPAPTFGANWLAGLFERLGGWKGAILGAVMAFIAAPLGESYMFLHGIHAAAASLSGMPVVYAGLAAEAILLFHFLQLATRSDLKGLSLGQKLRIIYFSKASRPIWAMAALTFLAALVLIDPARLGGLFQHWTESQILLLISGIHSIANVGYTTQILADAARASRGEVQGSSYYVPTVPGDFRQSRPFLENVRDLTGGQKDFAWQA